ncbi:Tat pathway signal protein, partial [Candidatus Entotheonella serta]
MLDRRLFLKLSSAAGLAAAIPRLAFAAAPTENRLVLVVLR